jgi:hypothetical protein
MIDIGLDGPEDEQQLHHCIAVIDEVARIQDALPADPVQLGGGQIYLLLAELPEPLVDLRLSLKAGVEAAHGALSQISLLINGSIPTTPVVVESLLRLALLGAGRVVYILGPETAEHRLANATVVLRQEARSLSKAYDAYEKFTQFRSLVPPQSVLTSQRLRNASLQGMGPLIGEEKTLAAMAVVIAQSLTRDGYAGLDTEAYLTEHCAWMFHMTSGCAHGFGWPRLLPSTGSFPGRFVSDLTLVANVSLLAVSLLRDSSS